MSELQSVEQIVDSIVKSSKSLVTILNAQRSQLNQMISFCNSAMQGASNASYYNCINGFTIALSQLENAINCLLLVGVVGEDWISKHTNKSSGRFNGNSVYGGYTGEVDSVNSGEIDKKTTPNVFQRIDPRNASNPYVDLVDYIDDYKISYLPISLFAGERSEKQIIDRLGGGDQTKGSCSSLAFAYCGNKAGYDVLDFRDGKSREFFGNKNYVQRIAELSNVNSKIEWGEDDLDCARDLMLYMEPGKEYYLGTGNHAAIVRRTNGHWEYLELQKPDGLNGWYLLHDESLIKRFHCNINKTRIPSFLIEVESLTNSTEFLDLLGYINTAESNQNKGDEGYEK